MKCYKAKWILTSTDKVLEDMAIVVDEGKIIDIIPNSDVNFDEKHIIQTQIFSGRGEIPHRQ